MTDTPYTREQAVARALKVTTYPVGMCARFTREQFGVGALGDYDGDGAADAEDMWKAAQSKHPSGTPSGDNPPDGVPVYYAGGSRDNGHIGIVAGGRLRGTDLPVTGRVGTVSLDEPVRRWGMTRLGWSDDLYGHIIPSEAALERARLESTRDRLRAHRKQITARLARIRAALRKATR